MKPLQTTFVHAVDAFQQHFDFLRNQANLEHQKMAGVDAVKSLRNQHCAICLKVDLENKFLKINTRGRPYFYCAKCVKTKK